MDPSYRIRRAGIEDAAVIAHHRAAMFRDMGDVSGEKAAPLEAASFIHLRQMIADRRYVGWLIERKEEVVAGGGLVVSQLLPRPRSLDGGAQALIVNVYTEPQYRRLGLARELMRAILDWCGENRIANVVLHASDEGRSLYDSLGFTLTNEMRWKGRVETRFNG